MNPKINGSANKRVSNDQPSLITPNNTPQRQELMRHNMLRMKNLERLRRIAREQAIETRRLSGLLPRKNVSESQSGRRASSTPPEGRQHWENVKIRFR